MMENSNTVTEIATAAENIQTNQTSPEESQASAKKAELTGLLANARNVKEMLENFKAACEGATVSGHVAVRFAIGIQWLESMMRQNKADIQNLQNKLDIK
jgi:hypothetical protein